MSRFASINLPVLTPVTLPDQDDAARFRCFDLSVAHFGTDRVLIHSNRSGTTRILTHAELGLLLQADRFRRRKVQEARMSRLAGTSPFDMAPMLDSWLALGFLIPEEELRSDLADLPSGQRSDVAISSVCIPTRDRVEQVTEALHAFLSNARVHGRTTRVLVGDGSSVPNQLRMRVELDRIRSQYGLPVEHLDDGWRARFIRRACAETDCSAAVLRFALYGDEGSLPNYGANRNALLLASAGELTVQVDDDMRLPVLTVPEASAGLALSAAVDPNEYWFDAEDTALVPADDVDFIGTHEALLGQTPGSAVAAADSLFIDDLDADLFRRLRQPGARIAVTMIGHCGDAGAESNASRLFLRGASLDRLTRPGYAERIRSRALVRGVRRRTLGSSRFCVAMNLGLDHRTTLPPFMPAGRNEDGVFSAVLQACSPHLLRGFPAEYVLRHTPSDDRRPYDVPARFAGFRVNDLMILLIDLLTAQRPVALEPDMRRLGTDLEEVGSLDEPVFVQLCRSRAREALGIVAKEVQISIQGLSGAGIALRGDLEEYGRSVEAWALREDCDVPEDLPGPADERRIRFRQLVRAYGELLTYWPDIVRVACFEHMHRNGHG